jgi:hypothetical protein
MIRKLILAAALSATVASPAFAGQDGRDRHVNVVNASGQVLRELYASPVTSQSWEEDMLGAGVLRPGQSIRANIDNGSSACQYDLKVVMANGREHVRRNVNVCTVSRWTITNGGNSLR